MVLKELFDLEINECPIEWDSKELSFWEGGATIIDGEKIRVLARRSYPFYSADEFVAHEMVHVARAHLGSTRFEEIFAYMTSRRAYRRLLGPLFSARWVRWGFVFSTIWSVITSVVLSSYGPFSIAQLVLVSIVFPFLFLSVPLEKLSLDRFKLTLCLKKLKQVFNVNPLYIAVRLTDEEILLFSKSKLEAIRRYIDQQEGDRWEEIRGYY